MNDKAQRIIASVGLALGGVFGIAGSFVESASLRGVFWGIDGAALVAAGALLTILYVRRGRELTAGGFLVFTVGQGLILGTAAMRLEAGAPLFGAGVSLWAVALLLVSIPWGFPLVVRLLGVVASVLFLIVAFRIFGGASLTALSRPLPFFAYPVLVATMAGWIWTVLRADADARSGNA